MTAVIVRLAGLMEHKRGGNYFCLVVREGFPGEVVVFLDLKDE